MSPQLVHIFGPLYIQAYGVLIVIGLIVFMWRVQKSDLFKKIFTGDQFQNLIIHSVVVGFIGGKLLHAVSEWQEYTAWYDILYFWHGGFSILGSVIALLAYVPYYVHKQGILLGAACDFLAIYAPLLQAIARLGCYFAGCCYGTAAALPWAIVYTDPSSAAPCHVPLHPAQLYSSLALYSIFLILRFVVFPHVQKKRLFGRGIILCTYLTLISIERFVVDFWRADRIFSESMRGAWALLSFHQYVAVAIFLVSCIGIIPLYYMHRARRS